MQKILLENDSQKKLYLKSDGGLQRKIDYLTFCFGVKDTDKFISFSIDYIDRNSNQSFKDLFHNKVFYSSDIYDKDNDIYLKSNKMSNSLYIKINKFRNNLNVNLNTLIEEKFTYNLFSAIYNFELFGMELSIHDYHVRNKELTSNGLLVEHIYNSIVQNSKKYNLSFYKTEIEGIKKTIEMLVITGVITNAQDFDKIFFK